MVELFGKEFKVKDKVEPFLTCFWLTYICHTCNKNYYPTKIVNYLTCYLTFSVTSCKIGFFVYIYIYMYMKDKKIEIAEKSMCGRYNKDLKRFS